MWWWNRKKEVDNLQNAVTDSFEHVRKDVHNINEWLRFLHQQNVWQQKTIEELKTKLSRVEHKPDIGPEIERKVETHPKVAGIQGRLLELEHRLNQVAIQSQSKEEAQKMLEQVKSLELQLASIPEPKEEEKIAPVQRHQSNLTAKVAKSVSKNSKEYIKQAIAAMISKYDNISGLKLREIMVDEQQICSRSTFYRLLGELEKEQGVQCQPNGKEKVYATIER